MAIPRGSTGLERLGNKLRVEGRGRQQSLPLSDSKAPGRSERHNLQNKTSWFFVKRGCYWVKRWEDAMGSPLSCHYVHKWDLLTWVLLSLWRGNTRGHVEGGYTRPAHFHLLSSEQSLSIIVLVSLNYWRNRALYKPSTKCSAFLGILSDPFPRF